MTIIHDVDRPDVDGTPAKMQAVADEAKAALEAPYLTFQCDDNLMSSVTIRGSFDPQEEWNYGIWQNSRYFMFRLCPAKGKRYYEEGEPVAVELLNGSYKIGKFRKSTTTPAKAIERIRKWIADNRS